MALILKLTDTIILKIQMYFLPTEIYCEIDFPDISISFIKYTFLIFAYIDI